MANPPGIDHDAIGKEVVREFFLAAIAFARPDVARIIDPKAPIEFLDKELLLPARGKGRRSRRFADVIARVQTLEGPKFIVVLFENQSSPDPDFPWRICEYAFLIYGLDRSPVLPIAIFTHDAPDTAVPDRFGWEVAGQAVVDFRFTVVQLNRLRWRDHLETTNPFAAVYLGKMGVAPEERVEAKVAGVRRLAALNADMTRAKMELAMQVVDTYLPLTPAENAVFRQRLGDLARKESDMPLKIVTSWERWARDAGRTEGIAEGETRAQLNMALRQLTRKFGTLSEETQGRVRALTPDRVQELADALLDFESAADLAKWLESGR
jgi:hypothetical protein